MVRQFLFTVLLSVSLFNVCARVTVAGKPDAAAPLPDNSVAESSSVFETKATDASQKWFITVLVRKDCRYCGRMISAFADHPDLQALVNTEDHRRSWANWHVCSMDDPTQAVRFKPPYSDLKIKGYPTLLIQPPASGQYGSAHTIVLHRTGYDGDASKLARQLKTSIERYAATAENSASPEAIASRRASSRLR